MTTENVWTVERVEELWTRCAEGVPWQRGGNYWDDKTITSYNGTAFVADCGNNLFTAQYAELIAASPEIIRFLLDSLTTARADVWVEAIRIVDTAPLCHCAGKQYIDPVALVQRLNAALEDNKGEGWWLEQQMSYTMFGLSVRSRISNMARTMTIITRWMNGAN